MSVDPSHIDELFAEVEQELASDAAATEDAATSPEVTAVLPVLTQDDLAASPEAVAPGDAGLIARPASGGQAGTRDVGLPSSPDESPEPVMSPGHAVVPVANRADSHTETGSTAHLSWGARSDVGLVREHNEDSYLVRAPVFAVCDGMGGHAAGEVASAIAVESIAEHAPLHADDQLLGAAVERANADVIEAAETGRGKEGMGCTATCALVEGSTMAVAHVGDSRIYLLHGGTLVRLTHDHSYVEELLEAGEITADEARVHPSRSVITRALGSDPELYVDHFSLDVVSGDRVIICSDGLSGMIEDSEIEGVAVSSASPQAAADNLVAAALTAGGHDNVSVVVIDVVNDGVLEAHRKARLRLLRNVAIGVAVALVALAGVAFALVRSSWYVGINGTTVGVYHGVRGSLLGIPTSSLVDATSIEVGDLPEAVRKALADGVRVGSEEEAESLVSSYREQIDAEKTTAAETAGRIGGADGAIEPDPAENGGGQADAPSGDEAVTDSAGAGQAAPGPTEGGGGA